MRRIFFLSFLMTCLFSLGIFAQATNSPQQKNQLDADDSIPVILKHLPDWENIRNRAVYITNPNDLQKTLGNRPIFDLISFVGGTEAATANYDAGKLLIVEYSTPQFSIDAHNDIEQRLTENPSNPPIYVKRIGNYEVFVFDATDETAANLLIDEVKYEKNVQWLGQDPLLFQRAQRAYLKTTSDVFVSTILSILLGLSFAILTGIIAGFLVFYVRKQKRAAMHTFSDAGGMVRLNLDELTSDIMPERLLGD